MSRYAAERCGAVPARDRSVDPVSHPVRQPEPEGHPPRSGRGGDARGGAAREAHGRDGTGGDPGLVTAGRDGIQEASEAAPDGPVEHQPPADPEAVPEGVPVGLLPALAVVTVLFGGSLVGLAVTSLRPGAVVGAGLSAGAWRDVLGDPAFHHAVAFTAEIAAVSTLLAVLLGVIAAAVLRHASGAVRAAAAVAIPVPHLVVAALAVAWLGPGGLAERFLGGLPLDVVGDRRGLGIVIVYLVKEVPFLTVLALAAWDEPTIAREEAAAALGAEPGPALRRRRDPPPRVPVTRARSSWPPS